MTMRNIAKGLGWFSVGLGTVQLLAPRRLSRAIGVEEKSGTMRALGLREVATGMGILTQRQPSTGLWARVAGDAMDLTLLARASKRKASRPGRIAVASGLVLAVGVVDYLSARAVQK